MAAGHRSRRRPPPYLDPTVANGLVGSRERWLGPALLDAAFEASLAIFGGRSVELAARYR